MPDSIDHAVIAVGDLDQAAADFAAAGFTVTPGGEHRGGATHNALVCFADGAYFELIAIKDPVKGADHPWFAGMERGDGAVAFALLADDLEGLAARLAEAGLAVSPVREGGRTRPDGVALAWRVFSIESTPSAPLPFLITDVTPRNLRVPDGAAIVHPLGEPRVDGIAIAVRDLAAACKPFAALLGAGTEIDVPRFSGVRARMRFGLGRQWIDLIEPEEPHGDAGERLRRRGDGIFRIELAGAVPGTAPAELPLDLTHGVRIAVRA